jgi:hypothetical protein
VKNRDPISTASDRSSTPSQLDKTSGLPADENIPEWWSVYEGLTDEEADRLDRAIRERADFTRHFQ